MTKLLIHNNEVDNVFDLLGTNENDITYSLSWAFSQVKPFLSYFIEKTIQKKINIDEIDILLQQYGDDKGYTDIELLSSEFFCIIEAKKGWNLPTKRQLERYRSRFKEYPKLFHKLLVISECKKEYADKTFNGYGLDFFVDFVSWRDVHKWAQVVYPRCRNKQKALIDELNRYFKKVITMQDKTSNEVYCVVVANTQLQNGFTFRDVVKRGYYFYPMKPRYPRIPPTYVAFRWSGRLQSIHFVESYEIIDKPDKYFPELAGWDGWSDCPHYLLKLGKSFKPDHEVLNGQIDNRQQIKCMLDTLFTCNTIQEARDLTNHRRNK